MSGTVTLNEPETVADLMRRLRDLGDIPPERVRMMPVPGKATEADLVRLARKTDRILELVEGTIIEKALGAQESGLTSRLQGRPEAALGEPELGFLFGADLTTRLMPGLVRGPDLTYVRMCKCPDGVYPTQPIPNLIPDLAVEVIGLSNTPGETLRKLKEYFIAGCELVWMIDPRKLTVAVHTAPDVRTVLEVGDTLTYPFLPEFSVPLEWLFRYVPRRQAAKPRKRKKS